jgi:predicted nucleic acid-binding protein
VIAYVDSSVLLRRALGQANSLARWAELEHGVASALVEVECLRTLDRFRLARSIEDRELSERRAAVLRLLGALDLIEPTRPVLARAAEPFPTPLGILDAIHLATALLWREQSGRELAMATHDTALALASRACGLDVVGA